MSLLKPFQSIAHYPRAGLIPKTEDVAGIPKPH